MSKEGTVNATVMTPPPIARPKENVVAVEEEARPAYWIPGAGPLPADFFLPTLA